MISVLKFLFVATEGIPWKARGILNAVETHWRSDIILTVVNGKYCRVDERRNLLLGRCSDFAQFIQSSSGVVAT